MIGKEEYPLNCIAIFQNMKHVTRNYMNRNEKILLHIKPDGAQKIVHGFHGNSLKSAGMV
ncbi:MAG TPA: hypothetical protein DDX81_10535 [Desulfofustis sp.]|jgi:UDP-N-acetylglucosamine 2-epimerase|nr:hypothetical protein [Desulfofustis sp.]